MLESIFLQILNMSFTGGVVILFVLLMRLLFIKTPKIFSYSLWFAPLFRLLCPFSFESMLSILPVNPNPISQNIGTAAVPPISTGLPILNTSINNIIPPPTPDVSVNPLQIWITIGALVWIIG